MPPERRNGQTGSLNNKDNVRKVLLIFRLVAAALVFAIGNQAFAVEVQRSSKARGRCTKAGEIHAMPGPYMPPLQSKQMYSPSMLTVGSSQVGHGGPSFLGAWMAGSSMSSRSGLSFAMEALYQIFHSGEIFLHICWRGPAKLFVGYILTRVCGSEIVRLHRL